MTTIEELLESLIAPMGIRPRSQDEGDPVRDLLEDFEAIGAAGEVALVFKQKGATDFVEGVRAAAAASLLGLSSLDYAKRRYVFNRPHTVPTPQHRLRDQYVAAYHSAKKYISRIRNKFGPADRECRLGVFGADLVLTRASMSFFCAHLLYQLGHRYEGHAVSRLILEQIAWAYAACPHDDIEVIAGISATRSLTGLKAVDPDAGRLYGFLSSKTHLDYYSHIDFLRTSKEGNIVLTAEAEFAEYGEVILRLADLYGIVYETAQYEFIAKPETIRATDRAQVLASRPFAKTMAKHRRAFSTILVRRQRHERP